MKRFGRRIVSKGRRSAERGRTASREPVLLKYRCCPLQSPSLSLSVPHAGRAARGGQGAAVARPSPSRRPRRPEGHLGREEGALGGGPDGLPGRRLLRQHREEAQHLPQVAGGKRQLGSEREGERDTAAAWSSTWVGIWSSGANHQGVLDRPGECGSRALCSETPTPPPPSPPLPRTHVPLASFPRFPRISYVSWKIRLIALLPSSWMRRRRVHAGAAAG